MGWPSGVTSIMMRARPLGSAMMMADDLLRVLPTIGSSGQHHDCHTGSTNTCLSKRFWRCHCAMSSC